MINLFIKIMHRTGFMGWIGYEPIEIKIAPKSE